MTRSRAGDGAGRSSLTTYNAQQSKQYDAVCSREDESNEDQKYLRVRPAMQPHGVLPVPTATPGTNEGAVASA